MVCKAESWLDKPTLEPIEALQIAVGAIQADDIRPHAKIDIAEAAIAKVPQGDAPIFNHFAPGLYLREIVIPAGSFLTSVMHKYEHPFFVLRGWISVYWTDESGEEFASTFRAGSYSITKPGTRRILFAHEETVWVTVHATDKTDPAEIVGDITSHENPLIEHEFLAGWRRANKSTLERERSSA